MAVPCPEHVAALGYRLVEAAGADLDRVCHSSEIDAGNFARFQGHNDDLSCSLFLRYNGSWTWIMGNLAIASHSEHDKEGFSDRLD